MIEDGRPCDEVLTHLLAVRRALGEAVRMVLTDRVAECLTTLGPADAEKAISHAAKLLVHA